MDIRLTNYQSTTAAGVDLNALRLALRDQKSGLRENDMPRSSLQTWIGRVSGVEDMDLGDWQSRNNALAALGLEQGTIKADIQALIKQYSAARIGLLMGSSTSSIDRTELAYTDLNEEGLLKTQYKQELVHNPHAPSLFVAHYTGITGPALTINTACSSSAKVFATAARWLQNNIVDAVLVGGVDTLCLSVLHGFDALQLVSANPCKPFDEHRDGINLGEAAGYAILQRADDLKDNAGIRLLGYGESSDAHHMSHPHPDGLGAKLAMQQALTMANLEPAAINYINLHGTASQANDYIEGSLVASLFPEDTLCSSTKAWMGHTLGAAGITEGLIAADALVTGLVPGSMNLASLDKRLDLNIRAENRMADLNYVMSNSFGFGGNNCCLIFGKVEN